MNMGSLKKGLSYLKYTALLILLYPVNSMGLFDVTSPTQASSLAGITTGSRVRATRDLEVRNHASISATLLSTEPLESRGIVVGGPMSANGFVWWQVRYDSGSTGWTDGADLAAVSPSRFFQHTQICL